MVERRGLRPFLKWVGGKRQLLPVLRRYCPPAPGANFEPFVGSGAVFFDLHAHGRLDGRPITLSDDNADLIGGYARVANSRPAVIAALERLAGGHAGDGRAHYLHVHDTRLNPQRAAWRATGSPVRPRIVNRASWNRRSAILTQPNVRVRHAAFAGPGPGTGAELVVSNIPPVPC